MEECRFRSELGFRSGDKGTHTSRTMMLAELSALLAICDPDASRDDYVHAVVEDNALGKATVATRRLSAQRLAELYALDRRVPIFRVLRRLWDFDAAGQDLCALLVSLARDPLLRSTAPSVLQLRDGESFDRGAMKDLLRRAVKDRLNDSTLDKVVRNAASSWAQSGHLEGRTFKVRRKVRATTGPAVMALFLGFLQGVRGVGILRSFWCQVLDADPDAITRLASGASMTGLIRFRRAGDVIEVGFPELLTANELEVLHEPN